MDCTAAKSHLLDELYGELDVDTSVELATHLAECAACSAELQALQGFRSEFQVPAVEIPADLTERIMARVDEAVAKKAAAPALALVGADRGAAPQPWMRTLAPVISKAGAWAMRPQTAMAAVFVLMVGSSAWLLGRGHAVTSDEPAAQLEQGAPLATPAGSVASEFDPEAARAAHGLVGGSRAAAPMAPGALPPAPVAPAADYASDNRAKRALDDQLPAAEPADKLAKDEARGDGEKKLAELEDNDAPREEPAKGSSQQAASGFSGAMQSYRAQRWDDATAGFEALARQGDTNAELWAARSVREGHGCRTALTRFDHLAGTAIGTPAGNDATLEGGICYRNLGQIESSTQRFQRLLAYDGWSARARTEIETNHRILVARREAQGNPSGGGAAAKSAAKPAAAAPAAGPTGQ